MGIEAQLSEELKNAMRAKNKPVLDVVRMVKSKGLEKKTASGYHGGDLTEEDWVEVIGAYVKSLQKSIPEFEKAGEAGRPKIEQLRFDIDYLARWLPSVFDAAKTREVVHSAIEALGARDPKQVGQVMGRIMKEYKGQVDSGLVKRLAEQRLAELAAG
jgi:uncharacterized protein